LGIQVNAGGTLCESSTLALLHFHGSEADYRPYLGFIRTYDPRCYSLRDRMLHLPIQVNSPLGEATTIQHIHSEYYSIHTLSWLALIALSHPTIPDSTGFDVLFIGPPLSLSLSNPGFWLLVAILLIDVLYFFL
jgi:hypothetical protein